MINTHLHLDHAGGNTTRRGDDMVPTFPKAEYWVQRREWDDALHPNERTRSTYLRENLLPIDKLRPASHSRWPTTDYSVRPVVDRARSHAGPHRCDGRGRQTIRPVCGRRLPVRGPPGAMAWVPAVDVEPIVSMETKRALIADAIARDRLVIFDHDPNVVAAQLTGSAERWQVEVVEREGASEGPEGRPGRCPGLGAGNVTISEVRT